MDHRPSATRLALVLALGVTGCTAPSPDLGPAGHEDGERHGDDAAAADDGDAAFATPGAEAGSEPTVDASSADASNADASSIDSHDAATASLADADADSEPPPAPTHVWSKTSARVRLTQFSYWTGGSHFEKQRGALTKEQLAALGGIKLKAWNGECWEDGLSASLTITDQDGSMAVYKMSGKCGQAEGQVLDEPSVNVFLKTLPCLNASETRFEPTTLAAAPLLGANDGCEHGFFGSPPWLMLDVTKADVPYTVRGLNCQHNQVQLALYDALGKTLLAKGTPEGAPGCQMIHYSFSSAGKYALELQGVGGDYFLQFTHE